MMTRQIILWCCLAILLCQAGITFYLPMLSDITRDLAGTSKFAALSLSTFLLGMGASVLVWGWLGTAFRSCQLLFCALLAYGVCTLLLALSNTSTTFLGLRLVQGALAGGISVAARALLAESFDGKALTRAYSRLSLCFVLSLGAFQFIGAVTAELTSWRTALGLIATASVLLAATFGTSRRTAPDYSRRGGTAQAALGAFALIAQPRFIFPVFAGGLGYSIIVVFNGNAPLIFAEDFNWSVWQYGMLGWPVSLAYLAGTLMLGKLANGENEARLLRHASTLLLAGALAMALAWTLFSSDAQAIWLPYCLMLVAQAIIYPASLSIASKRAEGSASWTMALVALVHQLMAASVNLMSGMLGTSPAGLVISCLILAGLAWLAAHKTY